MRVELILEAIDKATGPIRSVGAALEKLDRATPLARLRESRTEALEAQQTAQAGLVGALATAAAVAAPLKKATDAWNAYEDALTDVGLKADTAGPKLQKVSDAIRAQVRATNTASTELMKGLDGLMAGGVAADIGEKIIGPLARTSVATKSKMEDLSKTAVSLVNNLKIVPEQIGRALDAMHQTGKDGQFELKDMAQFFPKIGAQYAAMGQTGVGAVADLAAMLQVMRMNVGTAGEAVTNLSDLLNKIDKGPALKALEEAGVENVRKRMEEAQKTGRVMEETHAIISEALKKGAALKDIFSDKQALGGAQALMQHWEKFLEIRQKAMAANGVVDADFATRMGLGVEKARAFGVAMSELFTTLGQAVAPQMNATLDKLTAIVWQIEAWAKANPELVATLAKVATVGASLLVGLAALGLAVAVIKTGLLSLGIAFKVALLPLRIAWALFAGFFSGIGQGVAAAIASLGGWKIVLGGLGRLLVGLVAGPLALLRGALAALATALLGTPIGWVVAGVAAFAAAAYLVYRNWDKIGPWFAKLWQGIRTTAEAAWNGLVEWLSGLGERAVAALAAGWQGLKDAISTAVSDALEAVKSSISEKMGAIASLFDFNPLEMIQKALSPVLDFVGEWGSTLVGVFTTVFGKVEAFVSGAIDKIAAGFSKIGDVVSSIGDFFSSGPKTPKLVDPAQIDAAIAKSAELMAAVQRIAPAARDAIGQAEAVLRSANFTSHGVRMMETLAAGIRAGAASPIAAVRDVVQTIRDHLPHSPAKTGPLSDLDKVRFSETVAGAIARGAPSAVAAVRQLAGGLQAALPEGSGTGSGGFSPFAGSGGGSGGGVSTGGPVTVNLTLSPNISGESEGFLDKLRAALPDIAYELAAAIGAETTRRERTEY